LTGKIDIDKQNQFALSNTLVALPSFFYLRFVQTSVFHK